jgi:hypothetical protein
MNSQDAERLRSGMRAELVTPGDWIELDVDPSTRHRSIRKAFRQAVARNPAIERDAVRVIGLLDRTSQVASENGAFYCASMIMKEPPHGLVLASMLIQRCFGDPVPPGASARDVCAGLAASISVDPDWAGADVGVVTLQRLGPAVRTCLIDAGAVVQYIAPLMVTAAQIVMTFTCPCPPYVATAIELFDAMASSLVLTLTTDGTRAG